MKSGKRHLTDWMELPNQGKIRTLGEKETYKYLEADTLKQVEMKERKIKKEYLRTWKLLKTKRCMKNLIKKINTWAVSLVRYSGPFLKWSREELKQMNRRTRNLMTMHKALYPIDGVDRLCMKKARRKRTYRHWRQRWRIDTKALRVHWKTRRRTNYSHQKRNRKHDKKENDNN